MRKKERERKERVRKQLTLEGLLSSRQKWNYRLGSRERKARVEVSGSKI